MLLKIHFSLQQTIAWIDARGNQGVEEVSAGQPRGVALGVFKVVSRWIFLFLVMAGVLLGRLPQPCLGNGAGLPCSAVACACVAACSCQPAHAQALREQHNACGDAAALACHREELPHVFLPEPPEPAALTLPEAGPVWRAGRLPFVPGLARAPQAFVARLPRPPWFSCT